MKHQFLYIALFSMAMTFAVSNVTAQITSDPTTRTNPTTAHGEASYSGLVDVSAQAPKRIEFGKGKSSATVRGMTGQSGATYVIRARSGQVLVLTLSPGAGVGIKVEITGRFGHTVLLREERGGTYDIGLEENGEYTIFVGPTSGKSAAFTLGVRITRMTDI